MANSTASEVEKVNDLFAVQILRMVKVHIQLCAFMMAKEYVTKHKFTDPNIPPLLLLLIRTFALKQLLTNTQGLFECGYFNAESQDLIEASMQKLLDDLRPHMIPLVESYAIEYQDHNVIGNKYGDIYELQFEVSKRAKINDNVVPEWYHKYMKPTMKMIPPTTKL